MITRNRPNRRLILISQVYEPDPAAVGQYMADAARKLSSRGWRVLVYTANRGYDDPTVRYRSRELAADLEVRRLPLSSFGKRYLVVRIAGQLLFLAQCVIRGLFVRDLAGVFLTSVPPMAPLAGLALHWIRRVPLSYWVMDLNPDQAVALGEVRADSPLAIALDWLNRQLLRAAKEIITLDGFMADRLEAKSGIGREITVIPPWPMDEQLEVIPHDRNPFREEHGLEGKRVVMYSGNHTTSHPLTTLLETAVRLRDHDNLVFLFVGGGLAKRDVHEAIEKHRLTNVRTLPYQPLDRIKYSLSAADVHVIVMGNDLVGCVHPSKVYNAMALNRPILLIGPDPCHVSDIVAQFDVGWHIRHGEVEAAVRLLETVARLDQRVLDAMGARAGQAVRTRFSRDRLSRRLCEVVERGL